MDAESSVTGERGGLVSASRIGVPLILVLSAIGGIALAGIAIGQDHAQLADHETRLSHIEVKAEPVPLQLQEVKDRLGELERNQQSQSKSLERIEARLGTNR